MQKVYFHTFGCRVNQYETESMREKLSKAGYAVSSDFSNSDLCVINSCSVTAEADKKCRQFVRRLLRKNNHARMIVTGCYATRDPDSIKKISPRIELFSNQEKESLPQIVSGCSLLTKDSTLLSIFNGHTRAFVKVQDGCDATCTYCIIPSVRPTMESRPINEVILEVRNLLDHGYKEIVLSGIRLGSYGLHSSGGRVGKEHGELAHLLKDLIAIDANFRIRLSSLEITEVTDEILVIARDSNKICPHFHLPLQSGDDFILKRMGRWYDIKYFSGTVEKIRSYLPHAGLTTDVIVGFPGETEDHFMNTYRFLEVYFNGHHVFPYSPRPGTSSVKLPNPNHASTIRRRVQDLLILDQTLRKNFQNRFAGQKRMALAENNGAFTDNGIRLSAPVPLENGEFGKIEIPAV